MGDVVNPNNPPDDITPINISYDKDSLNLCLLMYSTEHGKTQPQAPRTKHNFTRRNVEL